MHNQVVTRNGLYCKRCLSFVGYGRGAGPCGGIEWLTPCDRCRERERQEQAKVELWATHECADPNCTVMFTPRRGGQRFCCDLHRKRTHRRAKAAADRAL